jgi:hypothetical protein
MTKRKQRNAISTHREPSLIDLEIDESGFQQWRGDSVRAPAFDEVAQDVIDLDRRAFSQIAIHRGRQRRSGRRHCAGVSCKKGFRRLVAASSGNRGGLVHHIDRQLGPTRRSHDFADRSAHQAGNGAEAGELDPFLPHRLHDVGRQTGVESGSLQRRVERFQSGRGLAVPLAINKLLKVGELDDATLVVDLGRDETDAADDRMFSEPFRQEIDVAHAIEHRKNHRLWSDGRGEIIHGRLERVRFHAQEDKVVSRVDLISAYQLRREDRITVRADDSEAITTELFRPGWRDEEDHVAASLSKPAAKLAADRTGAHNKDSHSRRREVLS